MLVRERAGASLRDGDAAEAMEEPLHWLTSAAVLFSDVTAESSPGPELRMRGLSFLAEAMLREALRLFRLYHGHPSGYLW
jgi:hypothetical protein